MTATPKTIQIFLPGGDPRGLRVAEITTRIVQVIEVPRTRLDEFSRMPESGQVGVYFLFGADESGADPQVYIGQTGDLRARLASHGTKKVFWQRALVLISRTNSLTQTHALFLEWHCLKLATEAGRYLRWTPFFGQIGALDKVELGWWPARPIPRVSRGHESVHGMGAV